jgi:hypothetical protein
MEIRFLDVAQQEFDEAVEYYNVESPGVGDQFLLEAPEALDRVRQFPSAWHTYRKQPLVSDVFLTARLPTLGIRNSGCGSGLPA